MTTRRPYFTIGVAVVGVAIITVTPVAPPSAPPDIRSLPVQLTAGELGTDLSTLGANFSLAPFVGEQQEIVELIDIFKSLNFGKLITFLQDIFAAVTFFNPFMSAGNFETAVTTGLAHTLDFPHLVLLLAGALAPAIIPLLQFAASPLSALLMGFVGPVLSPVAEVIDAIESLVGGDFKAALQELLAAPGSILTGADLNLDFVGKALGATLGKLLPIPGGVEIKTLDLALGGLFSPGASNAGTVAIGIPGEGPVQNMAGLAGSYTDIHGDHIPAVGGSLLNELGFQLFVPLIGLTTGVTGVGVGPIGADFTLEQAVGEVLGMGWDGGGAVAKAPLFGLGTLAAEALTHLSDHAADSTAAAGDSASGLGDAF